MSDPQLIPELGPTISIPNFTYTEMFTVSNQLRWRRPPHTTTNRDVLEQAWHGSRGTVRWEPVPVEVVP